VTYSVLLPRLSPEMVETFIFDQFDRAILGGTPAPGQKPLPGAALIEAVRAQTRTVDLKEVNRVLIQPHWRRDCDTPAP